MIYQFTCFGRYPICPLFSNNHQVSSNRAWQAKQSHSPGLYSHSSIQLHSRVAMQSRNNRHPRHVMHTWLFVWCLPKWCACPARCLRVHRATTNMLLWHVYWYPRCAKLHRSQQQT